MFPDELLEAIDECPVCYLPYGLAEPHGAYSAIGLDWLKAQALCERAAAAHGGVVMPPFAWHVCELPQFPWVIHQGATQPLASSVPYELFMQTVLCQIRAVDARGFQAAILVTGHYGGIEKSMRLLCEYYTRRTGSPLDLVALADWEAIEYEDEHQKYRGDHAGICETSQLMALRPELVDLSRNERESPTGPWIGVPWPLPDGRSPSRELGEKIVSSQILHLGKIQQRLLAEYAPQEDWTAPTLTDIAALWTRFHTTAWPYVDPRTLEERKRTPSPEFPGWETLGE